MSAGSFCRSASIVIRIAPRAWSMPSMRPRGKLRPTASAPSASLRRSPGSPNVVPGEVFFTLDLRHPEMLMLNQMESDITAAAEAIASDLGLAVSIDNIMNQPPVHFDPDCIAAVRSATTASGYSTRDIVSGAGHDAAYIARVAPAAMIFVPCRDGISHNEAEFTSNEQCAAGAQVHGNERKRFAQDTQFQRQVLGEVFELRVAAVGKGQTAEGDGGTAFDQKGDVLLGGRVGAFHKGNLLGDTPEIKPGFEFILTMSDFMA